MIARVDWHSTAKSEFIVFAAAAGLFMAALGPFGTGAAGIGTRLVYWIPLLIASWASMAVTLGVVGDGEPHGLLKRTARHAAMILLLSLPMTAAVFAWSRTIFDVPFGPERLPNLYRNVVLFAGTLLLLELLRQSRVQKVTREYPSELPQCFTDRLPPRLRDASLIALHAQDHYVQVFTSAGDTLIHARFGALIADLRDMDGAQVHRSWWVARQAVERIRWHNGRAALLLKNGRAAPVSRRFARALRPPHWPLDS